MIIYQNFLFQKDFVVLSKIKKSECDNIKLSHFNIINALEKFLEYKKEYEKTYKKNDINEKLYEELKTLTLLWECFSKEEFRKQKKKLYNIKLIQKSKEKDLKEYITENIEPLKVDLGDNKYDYIKIGIFELDKTLKELYYKYKEKFPNSELYNYDGFLLKENEKSIYRERFIALKCDERYMPNFLKLKLTQFLYIKDIDNLSKFLIPEENESFINLQNVNQFSYIYEGLIVIGGIENLILFYNYTESVNKEIEECKENIQENIHKKWIDDMEIMNKELFSNIIEHVKAISEKVYMENNDYKEFFDLYIQILEEYKELSRELISQLNIKKICNLDVLKNCFCEIIDKIIL